MTPLPSLVFSNCLWLNSPMERHCCWNLWPPCPILRYVLIFCLFFSKFNWHIGILIGNLNQFIWDHRQHHTLVKKNIVSLLILKTGHGTPHHYETPQNSMFVLGAYAGVQFISKKSGVHKLKTYFLQLLGNFSRLVVHFLSIEVES